MISASQVRQHFQGLAARLPWMRGLSSDSVMRHWRTLAKLAGTLPKLQVFLAPVIPQTALKLSPCCCASRSFDGRLYRSAASLDDEMIDRLSNNNILNEVSKLFCRPQPTTWRQRAVAQQGLRAPGERQWGRVAKGPNWQARPSH